MLYTALGTGGIDAQCARPALHSASKGICNAYAGLAGRDVVAAAYRHCPRLPGDVADAIAAARADPAHAVGRLSCLVDRWSAHLQERAPTGCSAALHITGASLLELAGEQEPGLAVSVGQVQMVWALGEKGRHDSGGIPRHPFQARSLCTVPDRNWPPLPSHAELAAGCADALTAGGQPLAALRTSTEALELLSHLRFAGCPDAACFQAAVLQLSRASTAAIQAGANPSEWQVVAVLRAAAQADACLRLPTWLGHGFAAAAARLTDTKAGFQTEAVSSRGSTSGSTGLEVVDRGQGPCQFAPAVRTSISAWRHHLT